MAGHNSPNSGWTPGDKLEIESTMISITPADLSYKEIYRILINSIIPRPIALISTRSNSGKNNLAPFSFFNGVSSNPATIMVSIAVKPDGTTKDTLKNILDTHEFVINSANSWLIEPLVYTAGDFDYGVDEMAEAGLTGIPSDIVKPLRVKESAIQFECSLYDQVKVGDGSAGSSTVIIGKIEKFHLASAVYQDGKVDLKAFKPIGRLGGISYTDLSKEFDIAIPKVPKTTTA